MYAIANAATTATVATSNITARELKVAQEAARLGRIYVRSTRVR